jgi:YfiH family protein
VATGTEQGDLAVGGPPTELARRRRAVIDRPWVWLDQVHGARVEALLDDTAPQDVCGRVADGSVTRREDVVLAVHTADCVPVGLVSTNGVIGAAHAGWRGLLAGVLPATVEAMQALGAVDIRAVLGPCIGVECYEFGEADRRAMVEAFGPAVAGHTEDGRPALDLGVAAERSLDSVGVPAVAVERWCTACGRPRGAGPPRPGSWYSHRARGDTGRQALVVWLEADTPAGERR